MTNPFESFQSTSGGRAGFSAFKDLTEDKAFDDETLQENPGAPLPSVLGENESPEFSRDVDVPDYEEDQRQKFNDLKKTVEAIDIDFETRFITPINEKKAQIVTIIGDAFQSAYGTGDPTQNLVGNSNPRLVDDISTFTIPNGFGVNQIINNEEVGITTFVYGTLQVGAGSTDVIGIKGNVYKDILAAYQYPNLTNSNASDLLPLVDPIHSRVSSESAHAFSASKHYKQNSLGIGQTVAGIGDTTLKTETIPVYTESPGASLGTFYFWNNSDLSSLSGNVSGSINTLVNQINVLRADLKREIGDVDGDVNGLRNTKHNEELSTWLSDAGDRTENIEDFQAGLNALTGLASTISAYNG